MATQISHRIIPSPSPNAKVLALGELQRATTIRERVEAYFKASPYGATDDDLRRDVQLAAIREGEREPPESSYRKRRTELAEENILVSDGTTRKNGNGQEALVWFHRDHILNPPPLRAREKKPSKLDQLRDENARLRSEVALLKEHLAARANG